MNSLEISEAEFRNLATGVTSMTVRRYSRAGTSGACGAECRVLSLLRGSYALGPR
jgi:hypothetical protein